MATKLGFSTGKGFIEKVDNAWYAEEAYNAQSADEAQHAGAADNADNAIKTDFTNEDWISIKTNNSNFRSSQLFKESGTYQIKINGVTLPLADINISSTGDDISVCGIKYIGATNEGMAIHFYQVTIAKDGKIVDDKSYVTQLLLLSDGSNYTTLYNLFSSIESNFEYRRIR